MMKPIQSVKIIFADGSSREIKVIKDSDEGFYKQEAITEKLQDHTIYVVNGAITDHPAFGLDLSG